MDSVKKKVLQELIDKMNNSHGDKMKQKFMKVETNDPEMAKEVVSDVLENESQSPMEDKMENEDDDSRLMDMYRNLK